MLFCLSAVRCHYRHPLHRGNSQPHQLRLLHQLPVVRRHHRRPAVPPLDQAQPVPTHQGSASCQALLLITLCITASAVCFFSPTLCSPGEPAGASVLPDVLGRAAGIQSLLRACGLWRGPGHHAHWRPRLLPGRPLEG